jgi:hypothetical protein
MVGDTKEHCATFSMGERTQRLNRIILCGEALLELRALTFASANDVLCFIRLH